MVTVHLCGHCPWPVKTMPGFPGASLGRLMAPELQLGLAGLGMQRYMSFMLTNEE